MTYIPIKKILALAELYPYAGEPPSSNFATADVRNQHPLFNFDPTTAEGMIWTTRMPLWYGGGNIVAVVQWCAASATSGNIGWDVTFERILAGTTDIDSDDWATAQATGATATSGTSGVTLRSSVTITAGSSGTDSIAAGDLYRVRLRSDVSISSKATGDWQNLCLYLYEA